MIIISQSKNLENEKEKKILFDYLDVLFEKLEQKNQEINEIEKELRGD